MTKCGRGVVGGHLWLELGEWQIVHPLVGLAFNSRLLDSLATYTITVDTLLVHLKPIIEHCRKHSHL